MMRHPGFVATATMVLLALPALASAADIKASPLAAFEPFVGGWGPDPASERVKENPEQADDIAFLFQWSAPDHAVLRFYEAVPDGDVERRIFEAIVVADPRTGELVMLGYQARNGFLYRGSFEVSADRFVRLYDVTYPPDQEFRDPADAARGTISYRDVCTLLGPDLLECTTERRRGGEWAPWGAGEPYRLVRVGVEPTPRAGGAE